MYLNLGDKEEKKRKITMAKTKLDIKKLFNELKTIGIFRQR